MPESIERLREVPAPFVSTLLASLCEGGPCTVVAPQPQEMADPCRAVVSLLPPAHRRSLTWAAGPRVPDAVRLRIVAQADGGGTRLSADGSADDPPLPNRYAEFVSSRIHSRQASAVGMLLDLLEDHAPDVSFAPYGFNHLIEAFLRAWPVLADPRAADHTDFVMDYLDSLPGFWEAGCPRLAVHLAGRFLRCLPPGDAQVYMERLRRAGSGGSLADLVQELKKKAVRGTRHG